MEDILFFSVVDIEDIENMEDIEDILIFSQGIPWKIS